ncbi:MAG: PqqD family protein, partial [Candidatus Omnitrophica bacterium]|nr:PqqD family protein [Candidatus Omnitrophota bacterium]
ILVPISNSSDDVRCIYTLNGDASKVWNLIDNKSSLGQIKKKLSAKLDISSADVDKELSGFLRDLKEARAIK